jgi:hypothetical protein
MKGKQFSILQYLQSIIPDTKVADVYTKKKIEGKEVRGVGKFKLSVWELDDIHPPKDICCSTCPPPI